MAEIYVTSTADSGSGSLRQAIADAADGDVILFDPTIFPAGQTTTIYLSSYITLNKDVGIYGGINDVNGGYTSGATKRYYVYRDIEGTRTKVVIASPDDAQEGETVLFENVCRVALDGQEATLLLRPNSTREAAAIISGLALVNGNSYVGAALYSLNTSINTLNDCQIENCSSPSNGGAIYTANTSINTLNGCVIAGCSATNGGGVYSANKSQNTLNGCIITDCTATTNGGGVYSYAESQNTLNNCTITNCSATTNGGGVFSTSTSQNTLNDCNISGCTATNGGGVYAIYTSQNTLNNCNFDATSSVFVSNTSALIISGGITTIAAAELGTASITIADGAALTITTSATIGAATFTSAGRGYLAVAAGIDTSSATLTNVVLCSYGAGLESFSARETTRTEIKLDWTQTDTTIPVLVEQKVGNSWETVVESTAGTYNVTVEPATRHLFRAFDGVSFHVDAAWHGIEAPQFKVVGIIVEADAQDVNWQAITEVINVDGAVRSGQSITILARIYDAYDNETVLLNETGNIVSVVYTLEKRSKSLFDYTWTPVEGHNEVEVSSECVLEDLQTSDAWTVDEDGYSFVLTPDTTEHTLFATPGVYRFRVKITLAEGNPVVFYEEINVVDE